jgi:hypothetical protein
LVDPPGSAFTFHIHNGGLAQLGLAYGCGENQPIVLATPMGTLGIGPESATTCGFTCENDYKGGMQQACSDCGNGVGADLPAGSTVDIIWDRRLYSSHTADPKCVGGATGIACALAQAVAPSVAQKGTLTVCTSGDSSGPGGFGGSCGQSEKIEFTVDLTKGEGTIEVK